METLNLSVNLENLTTEERDTLVKLVEKIGKMSKVWKPKKGETYWTICSCTSINAEWCDHMVDIERYEYGELYKTGEEAKEELTRRKMLTKWKRLSIEAGEEENEWDKNNWHWCVRYNYDYNCIETDNYKHWRFADVYFPTEESLLAAIKELGKENVKKYILGVRD